MMAKHPRGERKRDQPPEPAEEPGWRLFLAVPLPPAVKQQVTEIVAELAPDGWPVRWVAAETAHITLHFLGDTPPEFAELLRFALPGAVRTYTAFTLSTAQLGVFPNPRRPRVIWLGLDDPGRRLDRLHRTLARLLDALALPADEQRLHPHITLGRLRDPQATDPPDLAGAIQQRLREVSAMLTARPVPINEVILYRSFLGREGARHEPLAKAPLAPAKPAPAGPGGDAAAS